MRRTPNAADGPPHSGMAQVMERNIRALLARRRQEEEQAHWQDRLADRITAFTGSLRFVYCHLAIYGLWIVANLPGVPLPHFDPTYVVLAMVASVEAIFLSTFILITQNRITLVTAMAGRCQLIHADAMMRQRGGRVAPHSAFRRP
jgi:uncharacterized membrane protein